MKAELSMKNSMSAASNRSPAELAITVGPDAKEPGTLTEPPIQPDVQDLRRALQDEDAALIFDPKPPKASS